jgi:hypothetical protein
MATSVASRLVARRVLRAVVLGVVVAAIWAAAAPRAEAVNGLTVFPRVGGIHATFALRFVAPFETYEGRRGNDAYYFFEVDAAPKACDFYGSGNWLHMFLQRGDRASLLLEPPERSVGPQRWCPGRYVGHLNYDKDRGDGEPISSRRVASGIVFHVTRRDTPARRPRPRLTFFPSSGGLRETFIASFVARYRAGNLSHGREGIYYFVARGPRGCREIDTGVDFPYVRGARVLIDVDPSAIYTPSDDYRRRWCPGRYVGRVVYFRENREGRPVFRRRIASHIVFRVQRLVLPWW